MAVGGGSQKEVAGDSRRDRRGHKNFGPEGMLESEENSKEQDEA